MVNFPRNAPQHLQSLFAPFAVVVVTGALQKKGIFYTCIGQRGIT